MSSEGKTPVATLALADGSRLAYRATPGASPCVVFLGGFTSDMTGTKATALEVHCRDRGRAFVRFDYTGHGESSGRFEDGTIGRWASDAVAIIDQVAPGPLVLVGSSMGGWIAVLAALARPDRVSGLVGIAAAPDFPERIRTRLDDEARKTLDEEGVLYAPNPYGDEPTPITRRLLEEAESHLVLGGSVRLTCPVRLLHGMADPDVPWEVSARLAEALESRDVLLTVIKSGEHRLSDAENLQRILCAVEEVCELVAGA
jgi:pimeloyl-ACP methyl ester carboxylesterase